MNNEALIRSLYREFESLDVDSLLEKMTDNIWFRLGNTRPAVGKPAVRECLMDFFENVKRLHHEFCSIWNVPGQEHVVVCELTCIRADNSRLTIPSASVLRFEAGTNLLAEMQLFIDPAPLTIPYKSPWLSALERREYPEVHPTH